MEWRCEDKDTNVKKINCKVVILTKFVKWVIKKKWCARVEIIC